MKILSYHTCTAVEVNIEADTGPLLELVQDFHQFVVIIQKGINVQEKLGHFERVKPTLKMLLAS